MKKTMIDRFSDFMTGKGFYIALLLCVAALGVSGWYLFNGIADMSRAASAPAVVVATPRPTATASPVPTQPMADTAQPPVPTQGVPAVLPAVTAAPTPAPAAAPTATPTPAPATATASVFTWPVKGQVLRGWAIETLAYDETMGDWRAHDGVDIAADPGTLVLAPAGGTVCDLYNDDLMGTSVVILHADGVMSTCANLEAVPPVEIGDTVRTGDVIGAVGNSAIAESGEGSHLHLSMTKNGVSVDPLEYLPEKS